MSKKKKVHKSAKDGKFVSPEHAKAHPDTTYQETVPTKRPGPPVKEARTPVAKKSEETFLAAILRRLPELTDNGLSALADFVRDELRRRIGDDPGVREEHTYPTGPSQRVYLSIGGARYTLSMIPSNDTMHIELDPTSPIVQDIAQQFIKAQEKTIFHERYEDSKPTGTGAGEASRD